VLDLGPKARVVFCAAYVVVQLGAIAYGMRAPDRAFGFQMFRESSTLSFALQRKVRGKRRPVPVVDDAWWAKGRDGQLRRFAWNDRVRYRILARSGVTVHASRGLEGQLFRLQRALDDVAAHLHDDVQTQALIAVVTASHNGRREHELRLVAKRP
jgi:hypothetical protein